ncbi:MULTISPECIES: condensation domain-containing protein [unclassified Legionella]|uniref:condensation domain-containing protein n=1 Tax=unclassified Legionella TaxID=2622702 RepID=UPI001054BDFF|nr:MULTISPECIES: condensation domain-containing protein [unclassified Legionella]MDI9818313.1 condensation domain-containing protein [Legionella sp. PL877]
MRRPLGLWETACALIHDKGQGTANTCMAVYIKGKLDFFLLKKAFYNLYCRHPLLRATCYRDIQSYFFQTNADFHNIPLEQIIVDEENAWLEQFLQILKEPYPIHQYLWRSMLITSRSNLKDHCLLIGLHHSILDGASQLSILKDLLSFYEKLEQGQTPDLIQLSLIPAIEYHLPAGISWTQYNKNQKTIDNLFGPTPKLKFHNFSAENLEPKILFCDFDELILNKLQALCKEKKAKMTAVINTALLFASTELETSLHVPVNLRSYAKPVVSSEHIGCFISMVKTIHHINRKIDFWNLVQHYQYQFDNNFYLTGLTPKEFDIDEVASWFEIPEHSGRREFTAGFGISNWGKINFPERFGSLAVTGIHRGSGRQIGDFPYFLHIATINNKIWGAFSYVEPMMSTIWMNNYIKKFREILEDLALK